MHARKHLGHPLVSGLLGVRRISLDRAIWGVVPQERRPLGPPIHWSGRPGRRAGHRVSQAPLYLVSRLCGKPSEYPLVKEALSSALTMTRGESHLSKNRFTLQELCLGEMLRFKVPRFGNRHAGGRGARSGRCP